MISEQAKPQFIQNSSISLIVLYLCCMLLAACGSGDGGETNQTDFFNAYLPEELPLSTHQTELVWQSDASSNNGGKVEIYNELLGEINYAVISSDTQCYDYIWLFFFIFPTDFCLTDYAYIARVPLGIGVNPITITTSTLSGFVEETRTYTVTRYDYTPELEIEPNDDYYDAKFLSPPVVIQGEVSNKDIYDTFTITADSTRDYTVVITGTEDVTASQYTPYPTRNFPYFIVEDINTEMITGSDDDNYFFSGLLLNGRYANFRLVAGEQAFITVCCYGDYLLGVF